MVIHHHAQIKLLNPKLKNSSGPYSDSTGSIDLVDLLVGSEGIFGLITSATLRLKNKPQVYLDLFFTLPFVEHRDNGCLFGTGFFPVLCLLGSDVAPHVLPYWYVGWTAA